MPEDWGAVWRDQPGGPPLDIKALRRRESELSSATRAEILASIAAAALFLVVIGWRFAATYGYVPFVGLAVVAAWIAVSLVWFGKRLRGPSADTLGAPGVEHYRRELERRRDHLRNVWIWNGPLLAACVTLAVVFDSPFAMRRVATVWPLLVVLAVWVLFGIVRRRRMAAELQREIDELTG